MERIRGGRVFLAVLAGVLLVGSAAAAENLIANPSFEAGDTAPAAWTCFALGPSGWEHQGSDGGRCVSVTGLGDDVSWWAPKSRPRLEPNRLYYLSYWLRRDSQAAGGTPIAGLEWVNRDATAGVEWQQRSFFFRTPDVPLSSARPDVFRLGQWHVKGQVLFDRVSLTPAIAVRSRSTRTDLELGEGESIVAGRYAASHPLAGPGSTDFRCLSRFTARFNTNRWVFDGPQEVVYRHAVGRLRHTEPEVEVGVNLLDKGPLLIEASRDGRRWVKLGEMSSVGRTGFAAPSELLPTREMWVRLRTPGPAGLQVNHYGYRCRLPEAGPVGRMVGATRYLAVLRQSADLDVTVHALGDPQGGTGSVEMTVRNLRTRRSLRVSLAAKAKEGQTCESETRLSLSAGGSRRVTLPYDLRASGHHVVSLRVTAAPSEEPLWEGEVSFDVAPLYDARGGWVLSADDDLAAWWCEPERKVGRKRAAPEEKGDAVRIAAAANEYEAAQLVLAPRAPLREFQMTATDLAADSGALIPAAEVEIRQVEYVPVAQPTDDLGAVDDWPDPLPPCRAPLDLAPEMNHPFWITVHVSPGTPKGLYRGELRMTWAGGAMGVPLEVRVWGFELPRETHLRSGFGLSPWLIRRYHNLDTEEEFQEVYRRYLSDLANHRVAPYSFGRRIKVDWQAGRGKGLFPKLDFAGFDEDARFALDELGFNSFVIRLEGIGGGTYVSREPGKIGSLEQGKAEHELSFTRYARAIQDHLEERGWLRKAYVYWFDEPEEKDFDFVREGMELIHRAAPKITRLLTTKPDARLHGAVDLWCLPTYTLEPEVVRARQLAGEEMWWYLCTAPKAPHFTLFLDHYGTELRLWSWETWKYGLDGLLVWETTYWTSDYAYLEPALQNPWQDPMSWQSWEGLAPGEKAPWGNGDGRFLYPPNRDPGADRTKHLEGPVPSIRWELLRDGIEDYEYFWLLKQEVERLKRSGASPETRREAESLLEVPAEVCSSLTEFATTPEPIHNHRAKLAEAIERLQER